MTRLLEKPLRVDVALDAHGVPSEIHRSDSGEHAAVLEACSRWRVDDDWWRVPVSRLYYKLRTEDSLLEVFQDCSSGQWFLERVHD